MKRTMIVFAGFAVVLSVLWAGVASAANVRSGDSPRVGRDEVINGTLYAAGKDLKIEGTVQGDVMCAGQSVDISGTVEGDVLCAAQAITVSGHVTGDVRLAGQITTVSGEVEGSATLIGQTADITSTATIGRDVTITSQDSTVEGAIGRDLEAIVGNNFTLNSPIGRDLDVTSPSVTLNDKTVVTGTFMYVSTANANVAEGVEVGRTEHKIPAKTDDQPLMGPMTFIKAAVFTMAGFLVVALALLLVAPRLLKAASRNLQISPVGTVGAGLAGLVGLPFIAALSFATLIGIPLALVVFFVWAVSLLLGLVVTAYCLGTAIGRRFKWNDAWHDLLALVMGLAILFLLTLIPFIGGFVIFASVIWGAGAVWYTAFMHRKNTPVEVKK
jgi:hypothetical protein